MFTCVNIQNEDGKHLKIAYHKVFKCFNDSILGNRIYTHLGYDSEEELGVKTIPLGGEKNERSTGNRNREDRRTYLPEASDRQRQTRGA